VEYDAAGMKKAALAAIAGFALLALLALTSASALAQQNPQSPKGKSFANDAFSIELGGSPVCFAVPASLRDAAACKGLPPLGSSDIDTTQIGLIAAGGIRRAASEPVPPGSLPLLGLVQIFQVPAALATEPDAAFAERAALDATKTILAGLPSEARRGKPALRIESVDGLVVARTTVEVDDLAPGTRASFFSHIETATVFGRDAAYTVVWSGPPSSSAALAHLANDATKTLRLTVAQHPAARDSGGSNVNLMAKTLLPLGFLALAGAAFVRKRRAKSGRLRAELWPAHND